MPSRPPAFRPARGPGTEAARREAEAATDRRRRTESPTRALYGTARWQLLRAHQLAHEPLCRLCLAEDWITPATVCDHVEPHRGDIARFWRGPFQSLCKPHHDSAKQREEQAGRG
jgi:hypothetical protein